MKGVVNVLLLIITALTLYSYLVIIREDSRLFHVRCIQSTPITSHRSSSVTISDDEKRRILSYQLNETSTHIPGTSQLLSYPLFSLNRPSTTSVKLPYILPLTSPKNTFPPYDKPILHSGIVFYVYNHAQCKGNSAYMGQVKVNAKSIKEKDPMINVCLVTNCDVPLSVASFLDVIVPIHNEDVMNTTEKQWRTRVLYNAYLPFNYSFIIDSHVFPCDKNAARDLLMLFEQSGVDISFTNRVNKRGYVSGGGVLSRWSEGSFQFWKSCYKTMILKNKVDDQGSMSLTVQSDWKKLYKFKWLSNNWLFASHGITENGIFSGQGRCYRSSVIVTGPIRWIHGTESECPIMNGKNNEIANRPRCYFRKRKCNTTGIGTFPVFSEAELKKNVHPVKAPKLHWEICSTFSKTSLYWEDKYFHPSYN